MKVEAMIHHRMNLRLHLHFLLRRRMIHPTKRAYYPQHGGVFPVSFPLYEDAVVAHKLLPHREIKYSVYGAEKMPRMIRASKRGSGHAGEYQYQRQ
jgi:hypothetical protein